MPADEVTLDEIYAEVDKRIAALKTELVALLEKKQNVKEPFSIKRTKTA